MIRAYDYEQSPPRLKGDGGGGNWPKGGGNWHVAVYFPSKNIFLEGGGETGNVGGGETGSSQ